MACLLIVMMRWILLVFKDLWMCILHFISFGTSPAPEDFWFKSKITFLIKLERVDFSSPFEYKLKMGVSSFWIENWELNCIVLVFATSYTHHKILSVQCLVNCACVVALAWENEYTRKSALSITWAAELNRINCY